MTLVKLLILSLTLSAVCGLRCYSCKNASGAACPEIKECHPLANRCYSMKLGALVSKGCQNWLSCGFAWNCCKGDLCNGST
ncbi:CD59 glycoprotein-like [Oryzias melastigma]|uniref:CD59 glycoprotein-like n=1 Tax=Oryzias melastigma TaxID=30732 RepID=UPI000CF83C01|nr:CD59 glycoprotein-like [Oryzias melastigma]XP_024132080.1 CD59 glycoprotein-like [Oryzias melastigma]